MNIQRRARPLCSYCAINSTPSWFFRQPCKLWECRPRCYIFNSWWETPKTSLIPKFKVNGSTNLWNFTLRSQVTYVLVLFGTTKLWSANCSRNINSCLFILGFRVLLDREKQRHDVLQRQLEAVEYVKAQQSKYKGEAEWSPHQPHHV